MDASTWYGIALLSILAVRVLWQHRDKLIRGTRWAKGHIEHRVLVSRGLWSSATITIPDTVSLLVFIAVNVLLSVCGGDLASLAVINFLPLYLGGRTNIQADYLGIPLPVYQLVHRWLGRVFIVQSLIHSGQNLSSPNSSGKLAGAGAAVLLLVIFVTSLSPVRRWSPAVFRFAHRVLAVAILFGIGSHCVLMTNSFLSLPSVLCIIAAGLLITAWLLRSGRQLYRGHPTIIKHETVDSAVRLWVRCPRGMRTAPGTYFYARFPHLPLRLRFPSHLLPVAFWKTDSRGSTNDISFLVPYSEDLVKSLKRQRAPRISLDGPYGVPLSLGEYELVVLVADGQGIAGVMTLALSILSRRKWDAEDKNQGFRAGLHCDKTRKVDLIWRLDSNTQIEWAASYFRSLSSMETSYTGEGRRVAKNLLMVWILYPEPFEKGINVPLEKEWIERQMAAQQYPHVLAGLISEESNRTPGNSIIITCGTGPFVAQTRAAVRQSKASAIAFKELEYRPDSILKCQTGPPKMRQHQTLQKLGATRASVAHAFNRQVHRNRTTKPQPAHVTRQHEVHMGERHIELSPVRNGHGQRKARAREVFREKRRARVFSGDTDHGLSVTMNE